MRVMNLTTIVLISAATPALSIATIAASPAYAAAAPVTITTPDPTRSCVGDVDTASWSAPAEISGILGYRIVRVVDTLDPPVTTTDDVGPSQTALSFTPLFGWTTVSVYATTSAGVAPTPFAVGSVLVGQAPQATQWDYPSGSTVGDGKASVSYRWWNPKLFVASGGLPAPSVRVTATPGGSSVQLPINGSGVVATFGGLSNGTTYTFNAVTSNACGSAAGGPSAPYTPGTAPSWTKASPPLTAGRGTYSYRFVATGAPAPILSLFEAPSWLSIAPSGQVSGKPPAGTTSFSFSVRASNGVGIAPYENTDLRTTYSVSVASK